MCFEDSFYNGRYEHVAVQIHDFRRRRHGEGDTVTLSWVELVATLPTQLPNILFTYKKKKYQKNETKVRFKLD